MFYGVCLVASEGFSNGLSLALFAYRVDHVELVASCAEVGPGASLMELEAAMLSPTPAKPPPPPGLG